MKKSPGFQGFSRETVEFFFELAQHNEKAWFEAHRDVYKKHVMAESQDFVVDLGVRLLEHFPGLQAIPQVNQSLFRINRDTRFSPDKTPYKTHLGIFLWEGPGVKMESSGFYFQLEPPTILLAGGMHILPKHLLEPFRKRVSDAKHGAELATILTELQATGDIAVGGKSYKRIPRGYDADCLNADVLLHGGLYGFTEMEIPDALFSRDLLDFCLPRFLAMGPLHRWLVGLAESAALERK